MSEKTSTRVRRIAIVNRGEAAVRCLRTVQSLQAQGLPLTSVALFTAEDAGALFVRLADEAYPLPQPGTAVAAYLDIDALLEVLENVRADAVWPGWGFVAESADFVERLEQAGIRFLGPSAHTIRSLGDKIASKALAEQHDVPVTAWSHGAVADVAQAEHAASEIGFPLVVKASAGGGGRGIRMVHTKDALPGAFHSATSESLAAFGDGRVFLEGMVQNGRHIEVQVVADDHGHVFAVGCRDCSVQRRHQKVLEEAPPSGCSDSLLASMSESAARLAAAVGYSGVGTVEFLLQGDHFYFLEMNPRLQVEHGITEQTTGLDLVALQIRVGQGESLAGLQVESAGHCIEARLCAEDPQQGFLPAAGPIKVFEIAGGPGVRIDAGYAVGDTVPSAFDSLIAKVIATGSTREEARCRLMASLRAMHVAIDGGTTNRAFLLSLLQAEAYIKGGVDTHWVDRFLTSSAMPSDYLGEALACAAVVAYREDRALHTQRWLAAGAAVTLDEAPACDGLLVDLSHPSGAISVHVLCVAHDRYELSMQGRTMHLSFQPCGPMRARVRGQGVDCTATCSVGESDILVDIQGCTHRFGKGSAGQVRAPASATLLSLRCKEGDVVEAGAVLGSFEAMKMETSFLAPVSGRVSSIPVQPGQQLSPGQLMIVIEEDQCDDAGVASSPALCLPAPIGQARDTGQEQVAHLAEPTRALLLGYDAPVDQGARLARKFSQAEMPVQASARAAELAIWAGLLGIVVDLQRLFSRRPEPVGEGELESCLRVQLTRHLPTIERGLVSEEHLPATLARAVGRVLRHYHAPGQREEDRREVLMRVFSAQARKTDRDRLSLALLYRMQRLVTALPSEAPLERSIRLTLVRISRLRGDLSNAIADAALDTLRQLPAGPLGNALHSRRSPSLQALCSNPGAGADALHRTRTLVAELHGAEVRQVGADTEEFGTSCQAVELSGTLSLIAVGEWAQAAHVLRKLLQFRRSLHPQARHAEVFLFAAPNAQAAKAEAQVAQVVRDTVSDSAHDVPLELTLTLVHGQQLQHEAFELVGKRSRRVELHGLHPAVARRLDLVRYRGFELERLPASEGVYCFRGVALCDSSDQRLFVLVDAHGANADGCDAVSTEEALDMLEGALFEAALTLRQAVRNVDPRRRLHWNRIAVHQTVPVEADAAFARRLGHRVRLQLQHLGLDKVIMRFPLLGRGTGRSREVELVLTETAGARLDLSWRRPHRRPLQAAAPGERRSAAARRRGLWYPYDVVKLLASGAAEHIPSNATHSQRRIALPPGRFQEYELERSVDGRQRIAPVMRAPGHNPSGVVFGLISTPTAKVPEGLTRVLVMSDPTMALGALAEAECRRVIAAIDLAEQMQVPLEWLPISSGARIAKDSGTENLDWAARVVRRIVEFTQASGTIHLIVSGINVGAQSYWDALATMLMHCRGLLIMTPQASMVLTGPEALRASGSVSADDARALGGFEQVMGCNGEAQFFASDLLAAYDILYRHYEYTYVVPGEAAPRRFRSADATSRDVTQFPYHAPGDGFSTVGDIFSADENAARKRPFAMRVLMNAVIDRDGGFLERWARHEGADTAIVWDAHLGGHAVCMIGIESKPVPRTSRRPPDGPDTWSGGTLYPQSSKKIARALNSCSGVRPAVILANLSGFDGSPESLRELQLEYGAEIARAVVNFRGPLLFMVVSRYHGGAYVVFSRALNRELAAAAVEGSFASVIGGGPAAMVVFPREVSARVDSDPTLKQLRKDAQSTASAVTQEQLQRLESALLLEKRAEVAAEFDAVHTVERAQRVGSIEEIVSPSTIRPYLIAQLDQAAARVAELRGGRAARPRTSGDDARTPRVQQERPPG